MVETRRVPFDPVAWQCSTIFASLECDIVDGVQVYVSGHFIDMGKHLGDPGCRMVTGWEFLLTGRWKIARIVPIRLKEGVLGGGDVGAVYSVESTLEWEDWIVSPQVGGPWSRNVMVSRDYALIYYGSTSVLTREVRDQYLSPLVQVVSDVLFIKLQNGVAVDVDDEDAQGLLQEIAWMF